MKRAPSADGDNLSAADMRPASTAKDPTVFMARSWMEEALEKGKEKASVSSIYLDLKPLYAA